MKKDKNTVAVKLSEQSKDALGVLAFLLLNGRKVDKAHAIFQGLHLLFPDDAHVTKSLALTSYAMGEPETALRYVEASRPHVETPEEHLALDILRGQVLHALGREAEARDLLNATLEQRANGAATGSATL